MIISVVGDGISLLKKGGGTKQWLDFALLQHDGNIHDSLHVCCSIKIRCSIEKTVTEIFSHFLFSLVSANKMRTKVVLGSSQFRRAKSTWA